MFTPASISIGVLSFGACPVDFQCRARWLGSLKVRSQPGYPHRNLCTDSADCSNDTGAAGCSTDVGPAGCSSDVGPAGCSSDAGAVGVVGGWGSDAVAALGNGSSVFAGLDSICKYM